MSKAKPTPESPIIETIKAPYHFTSEELNGLGKNIVDRMREHQRTEAEAKSIAADYKAKLAIIDTRREELAQRISDGFEMRDTPALAVFNFPFPNRKTYYRLGENDAKGEFIREEEMSWEDKQRKLPLGNETLAASFSSAEQEGVK